MFQTMRHPSEGEITYVRPSTRFAASPANVRLPAPLLGQHSAQILREIGYSDREIAAFAERKVVLQPQIPDEPSALTKVKEPDTAPR
jgi:crotonobetainyl-CoA:carnitine CoA-transferase CaiB-like acyl-CoA transferase